jgi:hypothetical protein
MFHKYFMFYKVYRHQIAESVLRTRSSEETNKNTKGQVKKNMFVDGPHSHVTGDPYSRDRNQIDVKRTQNYTFESG